MGQRCVGPEGAIGGVAFREWCESTAAKPYLRALAYRHLCPTAALDRLAASATLVLDDPALVAMLRDWIDVTFDDGRSVHRD